MLTKIAYGTAVVLVTASASLAASEIHPRSGSHTIYNPIPIVTQPRSGCDFRMAFPSCSEGHGNLD